MFHLGRLPPFFEMIGLEQYCLPGLNALAYSSEDLPYRTEVNGREPRFDL